MPHEGRKLLAFAVITTLCATAPGSQSLQRRVESEIDRLTSLNSLSVFESVFPQLMHDTSSPISRLLRIGPRALPSILKHLDDQRLTQITIDSGTYQFVYERRWYEPRYGSKVEGLQLSHDNGRPIKTWRFRVGDICLELTGEIIGWPLQAFGRGPANAGFYYFVCSPTMNPDIVRHIRADWSSLTRAEHIQLLQKDMLCHKTGPDYHYSLERLRTYYPRTALEFEKRMLSRALYSQDETDKFVVHLVQAPASQRARILGSFMQTHTKAVFRAMPFWIRRRFFSNSHHGEAEYRKAAIDCIRTFHVDPRYCPFYESTDLGDQTTFIECLGNVRNHELRVRLKRLTKIALVAKSKLGVVRGDQELDGLLRACKRALGTES